MTSLLHTENISRVFGGLTAVESLSLDVGPREILGIIGPNGAGKTTAINVISGAYRPSAGKVFFDGTEITGMAPHTLVKLGLIRTFQATTVFGKTTVIENVLRGTYSWSYPGFWNSFLSTGKARRAQAEAMRAAEEVLSWLNMTHVARIRASDLPYGHQKCLGIAIAVAARPRLVLLDEPVAGLNGDEADLVRLAILKMRDRGIAVIVIDHNVRFMGNLCDRILVMHHGAEISRGTPKEVFSDRRVVEAYLGKANVSA